MHTTTPFLRTHFPTSVALQFRATHRSSQPPSFSPLLCGAQFGTVTHSPLIFLRCCAVLCTAQHRTVPRLTPPPNSHVWCTAPPRSCQQLPFPPSLFLLHLPPFLTSLIHPPSRCGFHHRTVPITQPFLLRRHSSSPSPFLTSLPPSTITVRFKKPHRDHHQTFFTPFVTKISSLSVSLL